MQSQLHRSGLLRFNEMTLSLRFKSDEINDLLHLLKASDASHEEKIFVARTDIPASLLPFFEETNETDQKDVLCLSPLFDRKTFVHHLNTLERNYQEANKPVMFYEQASTPQEFHATRSTLTSHVVSKNSKVTAKVHFAHPFEDVLTLSFMPFHRKEGQSEEITLEGEFVKFIGAHKVENLIEFEIHDSMIKATYFSRVHFEFQTYVYHL